METQQESRWRAVARRIDPHGRLLRTWPLTGGVSAQTVALEIERADGQTQRFVVRLHGERDLSANPNIAADEFRLLEIVRAQGIAAPAPVDFDLSSQIFPTPYIILEHVEGETDCPVLDVTVLDVGECIRQFAAQLAAIHGIDGAHPHLSFLPRHETRVNARLAARPRRDDAWFFAEQIRDALDEGRAFARRNRATLLHGDFWPGNVLWRDGRLVAVIDWEDAAIGDPLADLGNSRLEILWKWGSDATEMLTRSYASHTSLDFADLPRWDLYAALRHGSGLAEWGLDAAAEDAMREELRRFVMQAFKALK